MNLYLVRHGQTNLNKEGIVQGRKGLPLNEEGIAQAQALRKEFENLNFSAIFSSPAERAVETARLATGFDPIVDERINVFDLGEADGLKAKDVKTIMDGLVPDPEVYAGIEDLQHFINRIYSFLGDVIKKFEKNDNANILICGHKCTTGLISAYFEGMPADGNFLKLSASNGGYKIIDTNKFKEKDFG